MRAGEADEDYLSQQFEFIVFSTTSIDRQVESGKYMSIKELRGEQRRQLIDTQQVFDTWRQAHHEAKHRFAGSMRWGERNGTDYLLRKIGQTERSLGRRDVETPPCQCEVKHLSRAI